MRSARASGTRTRSRSASPRTSAAMAGGGAVAEAITACSRPTAPAIVSRSDSVHTARPASRLAASFSARAPPNSAGPASTSTPAAAAATGHRVNRSVSRTAAIVSGSRIPSDRRNGTMLAWPASGRTSCGTSAQTNSTTPPTMHTASTANSSGSR
jgi:hypothetical protein